MIHVSPGVSYLLLAVPRLAITPAAAYGAYRLVLLSDPTLIPSIPPSSHGAIVVLLTQYSFKSPPYPSGPLSSANTILDGFMLNPSLWLKETGQEIWM